MLEDDLMLQMEEKTIKRETIFKGKMIDLYLDTVALPAGGTATRELVFHPGAVAIVAINDEDRIILVKQFRKPVEQILLEIPAGKIDDRDHDSPEETALRELEEETGFTTDHLELVSAGFMSPGFSNERLWIYFTDRLQKVEHPRPQDDDEVLAVSTYSLEEILELMAAGEIVDAKTVIGLQYWQLKKQKG
ncbi:NUDIX hydrolase [Enterococcus timonensis]|uniref:NUDIX hydrolase n=1 Tax=Enterococcus timonensis TaxID=1852364 RepID=UPI000A7021E7|nr:NUDIX hydrolase [Enterococcus timonensis]